jgi:choline kinase
MRAIILSAGQGKRLLPLTLTKPKCLLEVNNSETLLEIQLTALASCGVERTTVVVGFGAEHIERYVKAARFDNMQIDTLYNPFYSVTDNLATCWMARDAMQDEFLLLNGDTVFSTDLLRSVLDAPQAPIRITIDRKGDYDADDMKVSLDEDNRLRAIGKTLPLHTVDGEAIGMLLFRKAGAETFRNTLERAIRQPESMRNWYLSIVDEMSRKVPIETTSIEGKWWAEVDSAEDLEAVRGHYLLQNNHPSDDGKPA